MHLQQNCDRHRHDHQPEALQRGPGRQVKALLYLRRHRSEAFDRRTDGEATDRGRRHEVHDHCERDRVRRCSPTVPGSLLRVRHGRVLPRQRQARADHLRRSVETGGGLIEYLLTQTSNQRRAVYTVSVTCESKPSICLPKRLLNVLMMTNIDRFT